MTELVSVGIPVYNGEKYIESAIRSNLDQTYSDIEVIICDNASTDRTEKICRQMAGSDSRIIYHRHARNIGAAANYNALFSLARGEYFRWSNADDLIAPELIERTLSVLQARKDVVIAFGQTTLIDADGNILEHYEDRMDIQNDAASVRFRRFYESVRLTNIIYGLMRSSALRHTDLMGNGKTPASDIAFMASLILQGKFVEIQEPLFFRRMHDAAFSANPDLQDQLKFWRASNISVSFPHFRAYVGEVAAIGRAPVTLREKVSLLAYSARRMSWRRRYLADDFRKFFSRKK